MVSTGIAAKSVKQYCTHISEFNALLVQKLTENTQNECAMGEETYREYLERIPDFTFDLNTGPLTALIGREQLIEEIILSMLDKRKRRGTAASTADTLMASIRRFLTFWPPTCQNYAYSQNIRNKMEVIRNMVREDRENLPLPLTHAMRDDILHPILTMSDREYHEQYEKVMRATMTAAGSAWLMRRDEIRLVKIGVKRRQNEELLTLLKRQTTPNGKEYFVMEFSHDKARKGAPPVTLPCRYPIVKAALLRWLRFRGDTPGYLFPKIQWDLIPPDSDTEDQPATPIIRWIYEKTWIQEPIECVRATLVETLGMATNLAAKYQARSLRAGEATEQLRKGITMNTLKINGR